MAEELSPDIVMTDIKMPYMDGLTLCRKLKELSRTIRVIIFSGFDEFEYAKEAIKMEAAEYLLKPVNAVELKEVFERVKNDLDRELDEKRNTDKLRAYYMESLPVLQESSLYGAIGRAESRRNRSDVIWIAIRCSLQGPYYVVAVLHLSPAVFGRRVPDGSVPAGSFSQKVCRGTGGRPMEKPCCHLSGGHYYDFPDAQQRRNAGIHQ